MTHIERAQELFDKRKCTCGGTDIGVGVMHEPTCGYPTPDDIAAVFAEVEREAREAGMREAAGICVSNCPACGGRGWNERTITVAAHGCGGDETICQSMCPVPEAELVQDQCEYCGRTVSEIEAAIAAREDGGR